MKRLLVMSLLMATMAWADGSKNPNQIDLQMGAGERCYDIKMKYFNHCHDVLIGHFVIGKYGNLISSRYDAKAPFTLPSDIMVTVIKYIENGDLNRFINQDNPKGTREVIPVHIHYQKQPVGKDNANTLRTRCANDKYCDVNELKNTLQEKGLSGYHWRAFTT